MLGSFILEGRSSTGPVTLAEFLVRAAAGLVEGAALEIDAKALVEGAAEGGEERAAGTPGVEGIEVTLAGFLQTAADPEKLIEESHAVG